MTQHAQIHGRVEIRQGDGANLVIRPGPVQVHTTEGDATLSWTDGDTHGTAAMPIANFHDYVKQGAIRLQA